jgi:glycosyltransferase involved in cell wall biosynthesis
MEDCQISVVIPVYNEVENIAPLYSELKAVLEKLEAAYEIIFVDDGSTDGTFQKIVDLRRADRLIKGIRFRRNFGQSAAFDVGFKAARGAVVVATDGDLQNDPADIPKMLEKLVEGYDVVAGWRFVRKDTLEKRIFSRFANALYRWLARVTVHDSGCSLRVYKKSCLEDLNLFGEMHRHIPAILLWKGFKIGEVKVSHRPRRFGKTKYSLTRLIKGFLDLFVVIFWQKYSARPIHIFGGLGLLMTTGGVILGTYLLIKRLFFNYGLSQRNTPLLAAILVIVGVQFIISGILADIAIKTYYSAGHQNYVVEKQFLD